MGNSASKKNQIDPNYRKVDFNEHNPFTEPV